MDLLPRPTLNVEREPRPVTGRVTGPAFFLCGCPELVANLARNQQ